MCYYLTILLDHSMAVYMKGNLEKKIKNKWKENVKGQELEHLKYFPQGERRGER